MYVVGWRCINVVGIVLVWNGGGGGCVVCMGNSSSGVVYVVGDAVVWYSCVVVCMYFD